METVEIREDPVFTPYCPPCKRVVGEATPVYRDACRAGTVHELEHHPDPEPEDA